MTHSAPNSGAPWQSHAPDAAVDTDAMVEVQPATEFKPAAFTITAKFQCGWYQYLHRWEFHGDGEIHAHLGMGGMLNPNDPSKSHTHRIYFRIDLDIDGFSSDVLEIFDYNGYLDPGGDTWTPRQPTRQAPGQHRDRRKFRVRDLNSTSAKGDLKGYEIELPQLASVDSRGTGEVGVRRLPRQLCPRGCRDWDALRPSGHLKGTHRCRSSWQISASA